MELREHSGIPIVFLSLKDNLSFILGAYEAGVYDYIILPQPLWVITMKITEAVKKSLSEGKSDDITQTIRFGENILNVNLEYRQLYINEEEVDLTSTEWDIFKVFLKRPNQIIPRKFF